MGISFFCRQNCRSETIRSGGGAWQLLADFGLRGRHGLVELTRPLLVGDDAECLLEELAGFQAVSALVAFGFDPDCAIRRDDNANDARHRMFSWSCDRVIGPWLLCDMCGALTKQPT